MRDTDLLEEALEKMPGFGFADLVKRVLRQAANQATPYMALPRLCCAAGGGQEDAVGPVSAAWRALILAARLLDDLEDEDSARFQNEFAPLRNAAVGLIFAAHWTLARWQPPGADAAQLAALTQAFDHAGLIACAGQHADLMRAALTLEQGWEVVTAKAGVPFELGCRAGALTACVTGEQADAYGRFGHHLGILTQISDDLAGVWAPRPNNRSDLTAGRRTIPILYALFVAEGARALELAALLERAAVDPAAERAARDLLTSLGAAHYMLLRAEAHYRQARQALALASPVESAGEQLSALLEQTCPWRAGVTVQPMNDL